MIDLDGVQLIKYLKRKNILYKGGEYNMRFDEPNTNEPVVPAEEPVVEAPAVEPEAVTPTE